MRKAKDELIEAKINTASLKGLTSSLKKQLYQVLEGFSDFGDSSRNLEKTLGNAKSHIKEAKKSLQEASNLLEDVSKKCGKRFNGAAAVRGQVKAASAQLGEAEEQLDHLEKEWDKSKDRQSGDQWKASVELALKTLGCVDKGDSQII